MNTRKLNRHGYCMRCGAPLRERIEADKLRDVCPACGWVHWKNPASASAAAIISRGTIVLVKRKVAPQAGKWCLPAGFQEYDETPEETAIREVKEETNLDIRIIRLHKVYFSKAYPGKNTVVHLYLAEPLGGRLRAGDDALEAKLFPLNKLPRALAFREQIKTLQLLAVKHPRATHTRTGTASAAKKRRSKKINVAVIMGGRTAEHDISLATGTMVVNNLNRTKYNVKPVIISQRGGWHVQRGYIATSWAPGPMLRTTRASSEPGRAITRIIDDGVDVVFLALHGPYGEDGAIQGMMEMLDLPYTGSDVCASAVAMDKIKTKQIYDYHRIPTPPSLVVTGRLWKKQRTKILKRIKTDIGYPCVVKPSRLGSSVGASICINEKALSKNIVVGFAYDNRLLVETFIQGREITCAVLDTPGGKPPVVLPPTEIVPRGSSYFDYHAKYTPGATDEITPAPLDKAATETIRRYALRAHEALGCHGKSRTDMIFSNGNVFVLETNTIPGLTETSLLPQAAKAHGLSFSRLLDRIITVALEAYRAKRRLKSTRDPVS